MTGSLLSKALEAYDETPTEVAELKNGTVKMEGPLATVFSKALAIAYSKDSPGDTEPAPALESQELELAAALQTPMAELVARDAAATSRSDVTIYGIDGGHLDKDTIVNLTNRMLNKQETGPWPFSVVLQPDGKLSDVMYPPLKDIVALEAIVTRLGGSFYRSFDDFVKTR
jgi:hypothetical protein